VKIFIKYLAAIIVYSLILSFLPTTLLINKAEAIGPDLKEIELNSSYYIMEADQYKDSTFFLGSLWDGENSRHDNIGISVLLNNHEVKEIVSSSKINNRYTIRLGESSDKLYYRSGDLWTGNKQYEYLIVDKNTKTYQSKKESDFFRDFHSVLQSKGDDPADYGNYSVLFNDNGPAWAEYTFWGENYEDNYTLFVNKKGVIHSPEIYEVEAPTVDKYGNLFYIDPRTSDIVKIDPDGSKFTYTLPYGEEIGGHMIIKDDGTFIAQSFANYNYRYLALTVNGDGLEIEAELQAAMLQKDNQGRLWFEQLEYHDTKAPSKIYGYYDENYERVDKYTELKTKAFFDYDMYGDTFVLFSENKLGFNNKIVPEVTIKTGWNKKQEKWFYYYPSGQRATGWIKPRNDWYYLNSGGEMQIGWIKLGLVWYHLQDDGSMSTGWVKYKNDWYLLSSSGAMKTGWAQKAGNWYYLGENGVMQSGWLKNNNAWYYLRESGEMKTGWLLNGHNWYFLETSGKMKTGWMLKKGSWYYLNSDGAMKTGWLKYRSHWYYLESDGSMAKNTTINGYLLGPDGAWIN
jgi:glucan-binding YG repeat protein